MKGRNKFTSKEFEQIKQLVKEKVEASSSEQKKIRDRIRRIGFYYSDFSDRKDGYTVFDLEMLVKSKKVLITDIVDNISPIKPNQEKSDDAFREEASVINELPQLLDNLKKNRFNPSTDKEILIANKPGNYVVCLKKGSELPSTQTSVDFEFFDGLKVVYTGISQKCLRTRDFKQHFKGNNAGRSTLRKSLGALFGYHPIPRDRDIHNGKTKFNEVNEKQLTTWMCENLILYFLPSENCHYNEDQLIAYLNPPLNLKGNSNPINRAFRKELSKLRTKQA